MHYSLYMESTPNPEVMKFVANKLLINKNIEILTKKEAQKIPIGKLLFNFSFVKSVFISGNFISITKNNSVNWEDVAIQMRVFILEKLNSESNEVLFKDYALTKKIKQNKESEKNKNHTNIEKQIAAILDEYISPAVESDGGHIELKSFLNGIVSVVLKGACSGCPSSTITLKQGIETLLKQKIGDKIKEVIAYQE